MRDQVFLGRNTLSGVGRRKLLEGERASIISIIKMTKFTFLNNKVVYYESKL